MDLNTENLENFIAENESLNDIEEDISNEIGIEREIDPEYAGHVLQNLTYHNISTIEELNETLQDFEDEVRGFILYGYENDWFETFKSGISLWYLSFAIFKNSGSDFHVLDFLHSRAISAPENRRKLACEIFNTSKQM